MSPKFSLNYTWFKVASIVSFALGCLIITFSLYVGKVQLFLLLNTNFGPFADFFFTYLSYLGDGSIIIIWLVVCLILKRKNLAILLLTTILVTTLLTQICKQVILPHRQRPVLTISNQSTVHYVKGVVVHSYNSFPSGHTTNAFTYLLLLSLLVKRKDVIVLSFVAGLLVGYSRIYLGQHFPLDVGGGMIVAVCTVVLSVLIAEWIIRKEHRRSQG